LANYDSRIPEDFIRKVSVTKPKKGNPIKRIQTPTDPKELQKLKQGPFMQKYRLEKIKLQPLKPTLRVETNYFDSYNQTLEEKRKNVSLRSNIH
jgi:hypothetical protein